jgi:predicted transport protein
MQAIKVGDNVSVVCSTVLDQVTLGLVDEEEVQEVTDRAYWEKKRGTVQTVKMVDKLLEVIKEFSPGLELKYNKFYIGLAENGQPNNFAIFRPQKNAMRLEVRLPKDEGMESKLNNAGLDVMDYDNKWGRYRIRLTKGEIDKNTEVLQEILSEAYRNTAR